LEEAQCAIYAHQLEAWHMQAGSAASGPEALGTLRAAAEAGQSYHFALLDVQMPEMDGLTLAHTVEQRKQLVGAARAARFFQRFVFWRAYCPRTSTSRVKSSLPSCARNWLSPCFVGAWT
jgi:CheY-like chemotaxis protein